jgi:hypothetical protein
VIPMDEFNLYVLTPSLIWRRRLTRRNCIADNHPSRCTRLLFSQAPYGRHPCHHGGKQPGAYGLQHEDVCVWHCSIGSTNCAFGAASIFVAQLAAAIDTRMFHERAQSDKVSCNSLCTTAMTLKDSC